MHYLSKEKSKIPSLEHGQQSLQRSNKSREIRKEKKEKMVRAKERMVRARMEKENSKSHATTLQKLKMDAIKVNSAQGTIEH